MNKDDQARMALVIAGEQLSGRSVGRQISHGTGSEEPEIGPLGDSKKVRTKLGQQLGLALFHRLDKIDHLAAQ